MPWPVCPIRAFYFEGGGACENAPACVKRSFEALGSSANLSATRNGSFAVGDVVEGWNKV